VIIVTRDREGRHESARIRVEPRAYGTQEVTLPDIPQAHPSRTDLQRDSRERVLLGKAFNRKDSERQFTLPLGKAADPFPPGKSFGVDRIFNGKAAPQPHTGTDYPVPPGAPVLAVADGTVLLARDLFYPGNAVIVDHGDGLVTLAFHLSEIAVEEGQVVKKGQRVGAVGATGRATGPHLFFGARWHNARIDPKFLFQDPARIPEIHDSAERPTSRKRARD
jgi:murein DD-endopeptidase MepM/ murein hydrolase activator NlpD